MGNKFTSYIRNKLAFVLLQKMLLVTLIRMIIQIPFRENFVCGPHCPLASLAI